VFLLDYCYCCLVWAVILPVFSQGFHWLRVRFVSAPGHSLCWLTDWLGGKCLMQGEDLLVSCYYIDCGMNAYGISPAQVSGWCVQILLFLTSTFSCFLAEYSVSYTCMPEHSTCKMTICRHLLFPQLYSNTPSDFDFKLERSAYCYGLFTSLPTCSSLQNIQFPVPLLQSSARIQLLIWLRGPSLCQFWHRLPGDTWEIRWRWWYPG
jgi:hypothetical protein